MSILTRLIAAIAIASFGTIPVTAMAATTVAQAPAAPGTLQGIVRDDTGAPVANASVAVRGVTSESVMTDATGAFSFTDLAPGVYQISVTKAGYQQATESDIAILASATSHLQVTLPRATFTSLRTIATVRATGAGQFNTSPASVSTVTNATFVDQGATGLTSVLDEIPGLQISLSSNDTNGAAPGAITYANIRDGLSFETATEIDGHSLSVGKYGDYVLSFWTPFVFSSFDTIKGPGADAPSTNYAINGTLNMRTLDPTQQFQSQFIAGVMSYGGTYFNARYSGTVGRLGFVADVGETNQDSPLDNVQAELANTTGGYVNGQNLGYNDNRSAVSGTTVQAYNNYSLLDCCYTVSGYLTKLNELLKLRYRLSGATVATVSYLGSQATSDENGDVLEDTPSVFQPGAGYSGPVPVGAHVLESDVYPAPDLETSNEPLFQSEVSTTLGNDTILGRYYHAGIQRIITQGNTNAQVPNVEYDTLNGVNENNGIVYNNVYTPVDYYEFFDESEIDSLSGFDLQYQHPYGLGNTLTASYSRTFSTTTAYEAEADTDAYPVVTAGVQDVTIPTGTEEVFTTYRLSDLQNFGEKFNARLTLYQNDYELTGATKCGTGSSYTAPSTGTQCLLDGSNATFQTTKPTHFDERLGLTYRPKNNLVFRASAGSSIAPPYAGLISKFSAVPNCSSCSKPGNQNPITVSLNNPNLVPETAFGYDVGFDFRPRPNYYFAGDAYLTNLHNQFLTSTIDSGLQCSTVTFPGSNCGAPNSMENPEVYYTLNGNLSTARYEGVELSLQHAVTNGFGWVVKGSTQRGYAYDLSPNFYCNFAPTPAKPCIPANYNTNLAIDNGENFVGGGAGTYYLSNGASGAGNGVSNQSVPYLQGYAEINWQNSNGWFASVGSTLLGKNNSYNEPPFTVVRATLRAPITKTLSLQVSGNNIFNAYSGFFPIIGGGVGIPLANGGLAPSLGNVVGPATYSVQLKESLGGSL